MQPITARLGVAESWLRAAITELDGAHAATTYSASRDANELDLRDELWTLSYRLGAVLSDTEALARRLAADVVPLCMEQRTLDGYLCTEPRGHEEPHLARGSDQRPLASWSAPIWRPR